MSDDEIEISSLLVETRGSLRGFGIITISIINTSIHLFARVYSKWRWWSALLPFFHCIYTAIVVHTTHFQRCDKCDYQQFHLASSIILDLILNDITFYKYMCMDNFVYVFVVVVIVATPRLSPINFITLVHAHTHISYEIKIKVCTQKRKTLLTRSRTYDTTKFNQRTKQNWAQTIHRQIIIATINEWDNLKKNTLFHST